MEIDETLRKTVLENLNEIGISVDKIDERTMGHLARIESAIEDKLRERDDALETIKSCSLSVKSIFEASGGLVSNLLQQTTPQGVRGAKTKRFGNRQFI